MRTRRTSQPGLKKKTPARSARRAGALPKAGDAGGGVSLREAENARARARILSAARKLFIRRGFEDVSMRDIARAAGYTPGALYVHFADKVDLVFQMMQEDFRNFDAGMADAATIADPVVRLRELARGYVRFALAHPHHYKLMFMTEPPDFGPGRSSDLNCEHANSDREGYNMCRLTVADCIAQGRFLPQYKDVEVVTQTCWATVHGLVSLFITHGKMPWARFTDPLRAAYLKIDIHLDGLTGERAAWERVRAGGPAEGSAS